MMPEQQRVKFLANLLKCELITCSNQSNQSDSTSCANCIRSKRLKFIDFDDKSSNQSDCVTVENIQSSISEPISLETVQTRCDSLKSMINSLNDPQLLAEYMFFLFDEIQNSLATKDDRIKSQPQSIHTGTSGSRAADQTLVELENKIQHFEHTTNLKIVFFTQLASLFDSIDPQLIGLIEIYFC